MPTSVLHRSILFLSLLIPAGSYAAAKPQEADRPVAALPADPTEVESGRQALIDQAALLTRVRDVNFSLYSDLRSFVCREQILRFRGDLDGSRGRQLDTVEANLSFENGIEQYVDIVQNGERRPEMSSLGGAWSVGEFGTLLRQTEQLLGTQNVSFVGYSRIGDTPTATFSFD